MANFERRTLLAGLISLAAAGVPVRVYASQFQSIVVRSGKPMGVGPFVIGAFVTRTLEKHEAQAVDILRRANFRCELSYKSTNRHKERVLAAFVDYMLETDDLLYVAHALSSRGNSTWPQDQEARKATERRYVDRFKKSLLASANVGTGETSETSDRFPRLTQFCQVITGSIFREEFCDTNGCSRNVKSRIAQNLRVALQRDKLSQSTPNSQRKFRVRAFNKVEL